MMMEGKLITFEGYDGCGKSTAINRVGEALEAQGFYVIKIKTPGQTLMGKEIRRIVLSPEYALHGVSRFCLFLGDMIQTYYEIIRPAVENGKIVLCDRYADSTYVYQIIAADFWPDFTHRRAAKDFLHSGVLPDPDMTFVLDLPLEVAYQRAMQSAQVKGTGPTGDVFESEAMTVWKRRRAAYQALARSYAN